MFSIHTKYKKLLGYTHMFTFEGIKDTQIDNYPFSTNSDLLPNQNPNLERYLANLSLKD